jgi:hypothetical protein
MVHRRTAYFTSRMVYKQFDGEWLFMRELSSPPLSDVVNEFVDKYTQGHVITTSPNQTLEKEGVNVDAEGKQIPVKIYVLTTSLTYIPKGVVVKDGYETTEAQEISNDDTVRQHEPKKIEPDNLEGVFKNLDKTVLEKIRKAIPAD